MGKTIHFSQNKRILVDIKGSFEFFQNEFAMIIYILLICYIFLVLGLTKFKITPFLLLILNCLMFVFGFYGTDSKSLYWLYYYIFLVSFTLVACLPLQKMLTKKICSTPEKVYSLNKVFFWIIVFFFAYHFIVGGIPALSSNVLTERFNVTSSGLFGIPGRMAQFGTPVLLFYTSYFYFLRKQIKKYKKYDVYFYLAILLNLLYSLFSGTKASVISLLSLLIYVYSLRNYNKSIKELFKGRNLIIIGGIIIVGMVYFVYMFNKYNDQFSSMNFFEYLNYRLTNATVESGYYLLKKLPTGWGYENDFLYYIQKYFHIDLTDKIVYPLEIYVSNSMSGRIFSTFDAYYTPVTIGGFVELYYHFDFWCILIIPFFGFLFGKLIEKTKKTQNPFKYTMFVFLIQYLISFISKGGLMYYFINYILLVVIFGIIYALGNGFTIKKTNNIRKEKVIKASL